MIWDITFMLLSPIEDDVAQGMRLYKKRKYGIQYEYYFLWDGTKITLGKVRWHYRIRCPILGQTFRHRNGSPFEKSF